MVRETRITAIDNFFLAALVRVSRTGIPLTVQTTAAATIKSLF